MHNDGSLAASNLIKLKGKDWLDKQRIAGKVAAKTLLLLQELVQKKTTKSLLELDKIAEEFIVANGCKPTFLGYRGFPNSSCISINQQLVHGIASNYVLQDGDTVSFDLGATYEGAIADTAITCIYGKAKDARHLKLIAATEEALMKGIEAVKVGDQLGVIGKAISQCVKGRGFNIIQTYGGHGLEWEIPHAFPFVANKADVDEGIRIMPGLTIAIEPMLTDGSTKTWVDQDGWTVWCEASASAHFEHTIFVHEDHVEIITDRNNL